MFKKLLFLSLLNDLSVHFSSNRIVERVIAGWENEVWQENFLSSLTQPTDDAAISDIQKEELHATSRFDF